MWRKILLAWIFISLLSNVLAQPQAPKIIALVPNKTVLYEGELLEINASIAGLTKDTNYAWYFGDGHGISGNIPKAYYVFYIDTEQYSKDFNVSLTITNEAGSDTKSITIKVKRPSQVKAKVLYPDITTFYTKDQPHTLTLAILDYSGKIVTNPLVKCKSITAQIKDTNLELKLGVEGRFDITIPPNHEYNPVDFLRIKASCGFTNLDANIPLYFEPLYLEIVEPPLRDAKIYIGDNLGKIAFRVSDYPDNGSVKKAIVYAELFADGNSIQVAPTKIEENLFYADFNYIFKLEDFKKRFAIKIYGQDEFGNIIKESQYEFNVLNNNPRFNIELQSPKLYRDVTLGIMEKIQLTVALSTDLNIDLENVSVFLNMPEFGITQRFKRNGNIFSLDFVAPARSAMYTPFEIIALAEGTNYADIEAYRATITRDVKITFLYPSEKEKTAFSSENRLIVELRYPDGTLLSADKVKATLMIDERSQEIVLTRDKNRGYYYFNFADKFLGEHKLRLEISETFFGSKSITCTIEEQIPWHIIVMLLVVVVAFAIFAYVLITRAKYGAAEKRKLLSRLSQIETEMKDYQAALFSRKISIEDYKSKMILLQNEMDTIEKELQKPHGFNKGVFAKNIFTRLSSIALAIKSLMPKRALAPKTETKVIKEAEMLKEAPKETIQPMPMRNEPAIVPEWPKPPPAMEAKFELPEEIVPEIRIKKIEPLPKIKPAEKPIEKIEKIEKETTLAKMLAKEEEGQKPAARPEISASIERPAEEESGLYSKEELETINKLCKTLGPAKEKYKPGAIYRALIEEGYKPHIALEVVQRIFKIY